MYYSVNDICLHTSSLKPGLYSMRLYTPTLGTAVYTSVAGWAQRIRAFSPTVADKVQSCWTFKANPYIPGQSVMIHRVTVLNANVIMADGDVNTDEVPVALAEANHCLYVTTRKCHHWFIPEITNPNAAVTCVLNELINEKEGRLNHIFTWHCDTNSRILSPMTCWCRHQ